MTFEHGLPEDKPPFIVRFLYKISGKVRRWYDQREAKRKELELLAYTDELTGLPNRRKFAKDLASELERCRFANSNFAVAYIDIDGMKTLNDTFGHLSVDDGLKELGTVLQSLTRGHERRSVDRRGSERRVGYNGRPDTFYRWGGDELTGILPDVNPNQKEHVYERARRIYDAIRQVPIHYNGETVTQLSASIGIAIFPDDGTNVSALLEAADNNLYGAKHTVGTRINGG